MAPACGGGRQRGSWHWPPAHREGAARGRAPAGSRTDCHQVGARHVGGLGLQECWALPSTGRTQAELGQCWHWRYLTVPASSTYSPAQGQNTRGPRQPPKAGTVRGVPAQVWAVPWAQGQAVPSLCSPVPGPLPAAGSGRGMGRQWAAAAEAWPLLLLKGTGGSRQAQGRQQGAGTQRTEPGTQLRRGRGWEGQGDAVAQAGISPGGRATPVPASPP